MVFDQPVAVLGGGGFIGANLVARLVELGATDVRAIDIEFPAFRAHLLAGAECKTLDMTNPYDANAAAKDCGMVFHLAADMGGVGYFHSAADLGASMRNNRMTLNVIDACLGQAVPPRLFYAASACAYPIELMRPGARTLTEQQLGMGTPDAMYGADKLHGIRMCQRLPFARVGVFDTIYGPGQEHDGIRMKFPAAVVKKALAARVSGQLELWGDGTQSRTYLYIDDALDRILAIAALDDDRYPGPINVAAKESISCADVAVMCLEFAGVPHGVIMTDPTQPSGVLHRKCSSQRYRQLFGDYLELDYRSGFHKFMAWMETVEA